MLRAFTLLELLIVVGIIAILATLAVPVFHNFQLTSNLDNSAEEIINALRLAQNKTIASEGASSWGIYFSTSTSPHQYTLFKGENYLSRDVAADSISKISGTVLISEINLGGGSEVVFNRISGEAGEYGSVKLVLKDDSSQFKIIYIESSGQAGLTSPVVPSELNRLKDYRHIHADYSRYVSTTTEDLILTFFYDSSTQTEIIPISSNMKGSQIYWEGQISVAGSPQELKIHTHRLNDPFLGTQFSIHRDRRYNNKALKIKLSGDSSGSLAEYSADGLSANYTSSYVTDFQRQ